MLSLILRVELHDAEGGCIDEGKEGTRLIIYVAIEFCISISYCHYIKRYHS